MDSKRHSGEGSYMGHATDDAPFPFFAACASQDAPASVDLHINAPSARDESYLFDLIGKIDHKVLQGYSFYIQVRGIAYRVLYGVYWRSVYSDEQYWGLRCEEIGRGMWAGDREDTNCIDLPIHYTNAGWTVEEQSLQFLLTCDLPLFEKII